jgi:hypothetical protein
VILSIEGFGDFVASIAASMATGQATLPRQDLHLLKYTRIHGARISPIVPSSNWIYPRLSPRGRFDHRTELNRVKELARAADRIKTQFKAAGYTVRRREYDVHGCKWSNLEVEILGSGRREELVVVGAHYDTADDRSRQGIWGSGLPGETEVQLVVVVRL